jgi:hypothetical protein
MQATRREFMASTLIETLTADLVGSHFSFRFSGM